MEVGPRRRFVQQRDDFGCTGRRGVEHRGSVKVQSLESRGVDHAGILLPGEVVERTIQRNDGVVALAVNRGPLRGGEIRRQRIAGAKESERFRVAEYATQALQI